MASQQFSPQTIGRLLTWLNNSKLQVSDNAAYQTIKNLITGLQTLGYDVGSVIDGTIEIIGSIDPSNTVEQLDGTNDPGTSLEYSRGDHKHDISPYLQINRTTVILDNDDVKALPTIPFDLVPAQGANTYVIPWWTILQCEFNFGAYTNVDPDFSWIASYINNYAWFSGFIGNDSTLPITFLTDFLGAADNITFLQMFEHAVNMADWGNVPSIIFVPAAMENQPLQLFADNNGAGNFTGGHASNVIKATTVWALVDK